MHSVAKESRRSRRSALLASTIFRIPTCHLQVVGVANCKTKNILSIISSRIPHKNVFQNFVYELDDKRETKAKPSFQIADHDACTRRERRSHLEPSRNPLSVLRSITGRYERLLSFVIAIWQNTNREISSFDSCNGNRGTFLCVSYHKPRHPLHVKRGYAEESDFKAESSGKVMDGAMRGFTRSLASSQPPRMLFWLQAYFVLIGDFGIIGDSMALY